MRRGRFVAKVFANYEIDIDLGGRKPKIAKSRSGRRISHIIRIYIILRAIEGVDERYV